ncbi:MAG: 50S ribosomal protein L17 [Pseudomonadota bacterium]
MRHRKAYRKLSRTSSHRQAMFHNMATSLFKHEKIVTTDEKAKELRSIVEKIITQAKRQDLHSRRLVADVIREKEVVRKIFTQIVTQMEGRAGGYTRIYKLANRKGDAAKMALIELVSKEKEDKKNKKAKTKKAAESVVEVKEVEALTEENAEVADVVEEVTQEVSQEVAPVEEVHAEVKEVVKEEQVESTEEIKKEE